MKVRAPSKLMRKSPAYRQLWDAIAPRLPLEMLECPFRRGKVELLVMARALHLDTLRRQREHGDGPAALAWQAAAEDSRVRARAWLPLLDLVAAEDVPGGRLTEDGDDLELRLVFDPSQPLLFLEHGDLRHG